MADRASGGTLPACPTCGNPPVPKKKKKRSQGNKDRKNKYNREKRALKRKIAREAKEQQVDGSVPDGWQSRVVRISEEPSVSSTSSNISLLSAVVTNPDEWQSRIVRVIEKPSVPAPDLNANVSLDPKRVRTRYHQTIQPWGTKEWKSAEEIEAWKATQTTTVGAPAEAAQVTAEEEVELDLGGPEFTELDIQPPPPLIRPDPSTFLYERYIQNAEAEQRHRENRFDETRRRNRERRNGARSERQNLVCPQPRDSAGRFIRRRVDRGGREVARKSAGLNKSHRSRPY
ncbi:hypothetical protein OUZ56_018246 [Daphnia magna]|uniref:Uncharacterized protein n=1 Tax=Daphnia magna TaxID=35525 RepID=A0ABQ9Z8D9_9CRUS|nr:hypothetical protein OUZ56_018246 [Daphnia magna]